MERFSAALAAAFISLKEEAITLFHLTSDDLPHTPQARKGETF